MTCFSFKNLHRRDFPGGQMIRSPPVKGGDVGSIPSPGNRSHIAAGATSLCTSTERSPHATGSSMTQPRLNPAKNNI